MRQEIHDRKTIQNATFVVRKSLQRMETLQTYVYSHLKNKHPEQYNIVQRAAINTNRKRQSDKMRKHSNHR